VAHHTVAALRYATATVYGLHVHASYLLQDAAAELIVVKADRDERIASKMSDRCFLATCSCCTCCVCAWMLLIVLLLLSPTVFRTYMDSVFRMSEPFR